MLSILSAQRGLHVGGGVGSANAASSIVLATVACVAATFDVPTHAVVAACLFERILCSSSCVI
jgi:hypothetical protein